LKIETEAEKHDYEIAEIVKQKALERKRHILATHKRHQR